MKHITFYFDFISPYAFLAFEQLPKALSGLSYQVTYKPVLFAGMLKHHGQLGPAEIAPKRIWTYRQVAWLAHENGIALQAPAAHPFNPLPLLRLALACGQEGACNRYVAETIFRHVWSSGKDAANEQRLAQLSKLLAPAQDAHGTNVKAQLQANTYEALSSDAFGVPLLCVDGQQFWGFDALPMLRQYLQGSPWFQQDSWRDAGQLPVGTSRVKL